MSRAPKSLSFAGSPIAPPDPLKVTMFAAPGAGNGPECPGKNDEAPATGATPSPPANRRLGEGGQRVAAAALKLQRAGDQAGADALLTLAAGDIGRPEERPVGRAAKRDTPWRAEARRLRAQGLSISAIAGLVGKSVGSVQWVVADDAYRRRAAERVRQRRGTVAEDGRVLRPPRPIRAVLPPPEVMAAAIRRAAKGEITADELSRILRREAP